MPGKTQAYRLLPWAWLAAWTLTGAGAVISNIYFPPSRNLVAFFVLSSVGWALASYITARASASKTGLAIQLAAWWLAYLVAVPLGILWMSKKGASTFLLFDPFLLAGAIGGFTSSARPGAWRLLSGSLVGIVFLLFSPVMIFYSGLMLLMLYNSAFNRYGDPLSSAYSWAWILPFVLFGLVSGFAVRWILGFKAVDPESH